MLHDTVPELVGRSAHWERFGGKLLMEMLRKETKQKNSKKKKLAKLKRRLQRENAGWHRLKSRVRQQPCVRRIALDFILHGRTAGSLAWLGIVIRVPSSEKLPREQHKCNALVRCVYASMQHPPPFEPVGLFVAAHHLQRPFPFHRDGGGLTLRCVRAVRSGGGGQTDCGHETQPIPGASEGGGGPKVPLRESLGHGVRLGERQG